MTSPPLPFCQRLSNEFPGITFKLTKQRHLEGQPKNLRLTGQQQNVIWDNRWKIKRLGRDFRWQEGKPAQESVAC